EEFVVLLPASDQRQAVVLAERIRQDIERLQLRHGDLPVALTISLGVATLGSTCASAEALLAAADAALYAAKHAGRNRVLCAPEAAIGETGSGVSPQPV
ncbi:MAG TPA: GGDEF domain-containing protein, partial [Pseudomonas sp.]|nr:GGDEF domain-containing protein [Pseudomonas sp.]